MGVEWQLNDTATYIRVHSFDFSRAFTYADTRLGHKDKDKREFIRTEAAKNFPKDVPSLRWWALRIYVKKSGNRPFDVENVPKLIVDAFSRKQIQEDKSEYKGLGLYDDDTIDYVRIVEVGGERTLNVDSTMVEIFGCK